MEQVDYRAVIRECLQAYAAVLASGVDAVEALVVADAASDNYLLIALGWDQQGRVHAPLVHIRLRANHVAVEFDGTEEGITPQLVAGGIRPDDIELSFVPPAERTELAFALRA